MRTRAKILLTAGALGFALATVPAGAQPYSHTYGTYYTPSRDGGPPEVVTVVPPRRGPERDEIGAPVEYVSLSKAVPYGDLDLRTRRGVRELRYRINFTAISLCGRLNTMYPITDGESWPVDQPCYENAIHEANYQVGHAIRAAYGYGGGY